MATKQSFELFVGRLSYFVNDMKLRDLFSQFGAIKTARVIRDPKSSKSKGYGFVKFESEVSAQKAVKVMNGRMVDGGIIFVEVAETEKRLAEH